MLLITRRTGDVVRITTDSGDIIEVTVARIKGREVRLGFDSKKVVEVCRLEASEPERASKIKKIINDILKTRRKR